MTMCKLLGVEPYISVNAGTGDDWSAAELVEYCNSDTSTIMGKQRAANGHPEPYAVKFWGVGNEAWGFSCQYGAMRLNQFESGGGQEIRKQPPQNCRFNNHEKDKNEFRPRSVQMYELVHPAASR
jgi:alpha-N-arabinofuranosidase